MFDLTLTTEFAAAHAIMLRGEREPVHGHNWRVTLVISGADLDQDGLLCDFHQVEQTLAEVVGRFHNANLNDTPPFDQLNPSAEHVARHIGENVDATLPSGVQVSAVTVTEAPNCAATWRPA
ncbi:MAG: 6-carboxytetrahydropterin synthase [Phycisphaerales bacterium]